MIAGVGIDIIEIDRFQKKICLGEENLFSSVFTERELDDHNQITPSAGRLAGKFAAKEAVLKALGCGLNPGFIWKNIEIFEKLHGNPEVALSGKIKLIASEMQINTIDLSITKTKSDATAFVIIYKNIQ